MSSYEIILGCFIGGVLLMLFEIVFPGGILGGLGAVLVIVGTYFAGRDLGAWQASALFLASVAVVSIAFYVLYRSPFGRVLIHDEHLSHPNSTTEIKVGDSGIALTDLRPSGKAVFSIGGHEKRLDVLTEGDYLPKEAAVQVSKIQGQQIIVSRKGESNAV